MPFPPVSFFENKKVLLLTHAGTDVDSLASAAALYFSLKNKKNAKIGVIDHINQSAKAFAQSLGIPFSINPSLEGLDCIVAFDFCDFEMAGSRKESLQKLREKIFVFDHHRKIMRLISIKQNSLIDESAVSTTEIVYNWLNKSGAKISQKAAICIAAGIIVDSAGFHVADASTFRIMADVFGKSKKSFSQIVSLFEVKRDISEGIARLKAAKRVRIFKSFDGLIAFSDVGSFESSAAMALIFLGAGISFVGDEEKGKILVSGRVKAGLVERTGFDLVRDVFNPLSEKFEGTGGGHAGAAAFNGSSKEIGPVLMECVRLSHAFFEKKSGKKSELKEYK